MTTSPTPRRGAARSDLERSPITDCAGSDKNRSVVSEAFRPYVTVESVNRAGAVPGEAGSVIYGPELALEVGRVSILPGISSAGGPPTKRTTASRLDIPQRPHSRRNWSDTLGSRRSRAECSRRERLTFRYSSHHPLSRSPSSIERWSPVFSSRNRTAHPSSSEVLGVIARFRTRRCRSRFGRILSLSSSPASSSASWSSRSPFQRVLPARRLHHRRLPSAEFRLVSTVKPRRDHPLRPRCNRPRIRSETRLQLSRTPSNRRVQPRMRSGPRHHRWSIRATSPRWKS